MFKYGYLNRKSNVICQKRIALNNQSGHEYFQDACFGLRK